MILGDGFFHYIRWVAILDRKAHRKAPAWLDAKILKFGCGGIKKSRRFGGPARMQHNQRAMKCLSQ